MMRDHVLSIDIGTSSVRCLLWDNAAENTGRVMAQIKYEMRTTPDGGSEIDAEALRLYVERCLDEAWSQAGEMAERIGAVGVSCFWHAMLGLDGTGAPATPIYNWADNRAAAAAMRLRLEWDAAEVFARTGCRIHPCYFPAKLAWLRSAYPDLWRNVTRWVSPADYLFSRWFDGALMTSVSMASGTGLFNQDKCAWDIELASWLGIGEEQLSGIAPGDACAQGLGPRYLHRWSALSSVPFAYAVGDGACGNVGSGCVTPNSRAINLGTSGAMRVAWGARDRGIAGQPSMGGGLWRYRIDANRPIVGAAFSAGGNVHAWLKRVIRFESAPKLDISRQPGAHGLCVRPAFAGERSPGWDPFARACIDGLTMDTSGEDILQACMEAVAMQFADAAEEMDRLVGPADRLIASGGAAAGSSEWLQMICDALGREIEIAPEMEASSRGAALIAMEKAGMITDLGALPPPIGQRLTPSNERFQQFLQLRQSSSRAV